MSLEHIISTMICETISDFRCGRGAFEKYGNGWKPVHALVFDFDLKIDHSKEDGYRHLYLIAYIPTNYIGIFTEETWDVKNKHGKEDIGRTGLQVHSYHDSCWRDDGVRDVIFKNRDRLDGIVGWDSFYQVRTLADGGEEYRKAIKNRYRG